MNCEKYLILIEELIDGELEKTSLAEVDSHLSGCPSCADFFDTARREKELYAGFLAEVEPPADLWTKFQTQMDAAAAPVAAREPEKHAEKSVWKTFLFGLLRPLPAVAAAALLVALGLGLAKFAAREDRSGNSAAARKDLNPAPATPAAEERAPQNAPVEKKFGPVPALEKANLKNDPPARKRIVRAVDKRSAVKRPKPNDALTAVKPETPAAAEPDENQMRLRALEKAAIAQIEKTELLLRAFRNARLGEENAVFDVGYEREQARRLLEKNVELRRFAETIGASWTQEILERVEPLLLDIANLETAPLPEKVRDIQLRVRSQNIIASLQTY